MTEEWRPVLSGDYEVSNEGRMRRAKPGRRTYAGRPVKANIAGAGYWMVNPVIDGRNVTTYLHRLVAEAFIGPPNGREVNHIDGDKLNCRIENLEYVTHRGNMAHAGRTGLMPTGERHYAFVRTPAFVAHVQAERARGVSYPKIAKALGVSPATVWKAANGGST